MCICQGQLHGWLLLGTGGVQIYSMPYAFIAYDGQLILALMGLAGVAVKAGARSALATLWHIDDQASSELVSDLYRQLQDPALSRAKALQRAQLKLLSHWRYEHPGYWAPFLLLNNWL